MAEDRPHPSSDVAFTPAVKAVQARRGSRESYARMEAKGYLESEQDSLPTGAIGLPRRIYRPTTLGKRVRRAWVALAREFGLEVP